jgi:hypothetical protein
LALLVQARGGSRDRSSSPDTGASVAGTTVAPADVDEPRGSVDLQAPPAGTDPVEVARWWAGSYTANVGALLPEALAERVAPASTPGLRAQLAAVPPAASYDPEPAEIAGVSNRAPVERAGRIEVRVTVETAGALAVYDLTLVPAGGSVGGGGGGDDGVGAAGRWLVDEATRR